MSDEWRGASTFSDWEVRLTPRRALALVEALEQLVDGLDENEEDDEGAADVVVQINAFPRPGNVGIVRPAGDENGPGKGREHLGSVGTIKRVLAQENIGADPLGHLAHPVGDGGVVSVAGRQIGAHQLVAEAVEMTG